MRIVVMYLTMVSVVLLLSGCPCREDINSEVTLTPLTDEIGYALEGDLGFFGTLTKTTDTSPEWVLEASFMFPASGYVALVPEVNVLGNEVSIRFPVVPPAIPIDADPIIEEIPVELEITASNDAVFTVEIRQLCM